MTVTDKIANIILVRAGRGSIDGSWAVADAIVAALPDMIPDLVWTDNSMGSRCETDSRYSISCWKHDCLFVDAYTTMRRHSTLEEAKAAANAHHKSALAKAMGWR